MRIEVQDEAAKLRTERVEIRCVSVLHARFTTCVTRTASTDVPPCQRQKLHECRDCGRCCVTECRCVPGEA